MQPTQRVDRKAALEVSLELAARRWKVALGSASRANPTVFSVDASNLWERLQQLLQRLAEFKARWGLPAGCRVALIYEAGQDGFWIARALQAQGVQAIVVDPASVPVARHARRAKTDRLDALKLLEVLRGWLRGHCGELRVLHIPSEAAEAERLTVRERLDLARRQLRDLEKALLPELSEEQRSRIAALDRLNGIGWVGATRLVLELFWRNFANRRQVGACVGLVPQPYDSGDSHVDQGISKQGNRRVRSLLIEMSWFWLRYQPNSDISQWFAKRTTGAAKRGKRIAIVAVARRLVIALWRYLRDGVMPAGAQLKNA